MKDKGLDKIFDLNYEPLLQGTPEWAQERLKKLTSSRFGDMMSRGRGKNEDYGVRAITYVHEKIAEHLTGVSHQIFGAALEWGTDHEDEAREKYEKLRDVKVVQCGFISWGEVAGGSPDGLVGDDGIIEIKNPFNSANHVKLMLTSEVDPNHIFQCQGNLMVTDREWCDYISHDPRMTEEAFQLVVVRVERNDEIISAISERIDEVNKYISELLANLI